MRILLALFIIVLFAPSAQAQNVFIKKQPESAPREFSGPDEEETKTPTPIFPPVAPSHAPVAGSSTVLANQYYKNCLKQNGKLMSAESQQIFCACTAAKITESMTPDEMRAVSKATEEGEKQRTRMTAMVYVPCMEYPTHDLIRANCETDPAIKDHFKEYKKVCECMATGMARYATENATVLVKQQIHDTGVANPDVEALLNGLLSSEAFQRKSEYYAASCTQSQEFGW